MSESRNKLGSELAKWERIGFMEGYYVVGIETIFYLGYRVAVNINSKETKLFWVKHWQYSTRHISRLPQNVLHGFRKEKETGVPQTTILCV